VGKLIVVTLTSEADAKAVRQALLDVQQKYTWVTLADYMEFVGRPSTFADEKVGWTELKDIPIKQVSEDEFLLDLPEPTNI
jgi:hypothetical protein